MIYDIVQVVPFEDYTVYVYFEDGAKLYVMMQNHYWIRKCLNRLETKISF